MELKEFIEVCDKLGFKSKNSLDAHSPDYIKLLIFSTDFTCSNLIFRIWQWNDMPSDKRIRFAWRDEWNDIKYFNTLEEIITYLFSGNDE